MSAKNKKKKKCLIIIAIISAFLFSLIIIITVSILLFGNPQCNKYIYIVQDTGLWGTFITSPPEIPDNYTGDYVSWYSNGQKKSEGKYVKKKPVGVHYYYNKEGRITRIYIYRVHLFDNDYIGKQQYFQIFYHKNGIKSRVTEYADSQFFSPQKETYWNTKGAIIKKMWKQNGKWISRKYNSNIDDKSLHITYHKNGKISKIEKYTDSSRTQIKTVK